MRWRALALVAVLAVVGAACRPAQVRTDPGRRPPVAPPTSAAVARPAAPATTTTLPLPRPIPIPEDPYAPEDVVELGTIEVPRLGLSQPIYHGVTLHNIDRGPSHWPGTALPGQHGNTVFAGHRVSHSAPFRNLHLLEPGDEVIFTLGSIRSVYEVTGNLVVEPTDVWIGDQEQGFTGTLYACHPPGSAAYRYVVRMTLATTTVPT